MRRRVTQRLIRIQAVWHPDNSFTNFERHRSILKIEADEKFCRRQFIWRAMGLTQGLRVHVKLRAKGWNMAPARCLWCSICCCLQSKNNCFDAKRWHLRTNLAAHVAGHVTSDRWSAAAAGTTLHFKLKGSCAKATSCESGFFFSKRLCVKQFEPGLSYSDPYVFGITL